jgi:hypothetical protein
LPRPLPLFFPPWLSLLTVAHARRAASLPLTPRFLYPRSIFVALRFCFDVYVFLLPRGIKVLFVVLHTKRISPRWRMENLKECRGLEPQAR